jgi:hypothetical protein
LKEYTLQLVYDEPLRLRMSEAARARAQAFSRDQFVNSFRDVLKPFLPSAVRAGATLPA